MATTPTSSSPPNSCSRAACTEGTTLVCGGVFAGSAHKSTVKLDVWGRSLQRLQRLVVFLHLLLLFGCPVGSLAGSLASDATYTACLAAPSTCTTLALNGNSLSGTIPTEMGKLTNLGEVALQSNSLTGPIPTEMGKLTLATKLTLQSNSLTSTIPTEMGKLSMAIEFTCQSNGVMTGTIPTELGGLTELQILRLNNMDLSGSIPTELGRLTDLTFVTLFQAKLSGVIPTELGRATKLTSIRINGQAPGFTGPIPTELGRLNVLKNLQIQHNALTGTIPTELAAVDSLTRMEACSNEGLCGEVPAGLTLAAQSCSWGNTANTKLGTTCPVACCNVLRKNAISCCWASSLSKTWEELAEEGMCKGDDNPAC